MSDNTTIQLVDVHGEPIKHQPAAAASREQLVLKVYNYFLNQPEAHEFLAEVISNTVDEDMLTTGRLQMRLDDPKFQAACLDYGSEAVINAALDENLPKAYAMLFQFSDLPLYQEETTEITEITYAELNELDQRFMQTPELILAKNVCDIQNEITGFLNGNCQKSITSFQANRIQEKFEDVTPYLNFEQRAAGYYNISIIHRALLGEKDFQDPKQNNAEKECLKKVLEYTSDYKRINYCINRLGNDFANKGTIRAAYRRALEATNVPNDLYKINLALAQCYLEEYRPRIGFNSTQAANNPEYEKLEKAEMYYQDALSYAKKPEQLSLLKNIAKLQFSQKKLPEWTETKTRIAMQFLQGEERCHALMEIASKNQKFSESYLERAMEEADHSRKIKKLHKKILLKKIDHHLRPIYQKQHNTEKLQNLDNILEKYKLAPQVPFNPLLKYTRKPREK